VIEVVALDGDIDVFVDDEKFMDGSALNLCVTVPPTSWRGRGALFGIAASASVVDEGTTLGLRDGQVAHRASMLNSPGCPETV
jgi:hypothetical protein